MNKILLLISLLFFSSFSLAIDNPDAPDYITPFEQRMAPLYKYIQEKASTTPEYAQGYSDILVALDKELNNAYSTLMSKLEEPEKTLLKESQRNWIKYRDSEYKFIEGNWDSRKFGSSYVMSVGDYKATLVNNRVLELLNYLRNY